MKYYIKYVTDCVMHLKSFHSEKARNTFERDFHRKHQFQEEYYVDMIFEGDVTFVSDGFVVDTDEFENTTSEVPVGKFKVGDKVRILEDEEGAEAGEIGIVIEINDGYTREWVTIQSESRIYGMGRWSVFTSNLELVNE